ncbi:uncharacterized protein BX664DRAFT_386014 [Halteromyces radiatus]|uniref:uncharacterized protein n=1 Tax=Halteromyces radiatus TaxID=101107 RepID=UPI0022205936|nr:uncharacterized protein BX664DRAFT_386014 [Halteromyces radiatus]KAI8089539.1 hypothetical protein BX664DRAFT_386014 [Halteromyces radiatus]
MSRQFGQSSVRSYQHLHNRTVLFGDASNRQTPSPSSSMFGSARSSPDRPVQLKMDDGDLEYLESQNEDRITGLSAKVQVLKSITGKIGEEIRHGNSLLDTMNDQFSNTNNVLGKTMHNFKIMASKQSASMMCYMTLFIVVAVFAAYYIFFK